MYWFVIMYLNLSEAIMYSDLGDRMAVIPMKVCDFDPIC